MAQNPIAHVPGSSQAAGSKQPLHVILTDASGNIVAFGSGGTSSTDGDAFTAGSSLGTPMMGERDDAGTVLADGKIGIPRLSSKRGVHVVLMNSAGVEQSVGGGTQYTEDAAAAADPIGNAQILVRKDTPADEVSADGDNIAHRGSKYGAAYVTLVDSTGAFVASAGGTQYTEDAAAAANPVGNALIAVRRDVLDVNEVSADGDNIALKSTNKGELYVKQTDAVPVTDNSGSLTVDFTGQQSTDFDSGAGSQTQVVVGLVVPGSGGGVAITGDNANGLDVDVTRSALPTGASTSAKQDTQITAQQAIQTSVEIMDDWDEADRAKVNPIAGQAGVAGGSGVVGATTQRVVLATDVALPAGTNAIGKLAANSGVDIGDVDVTTVGTITPGTAATSLGKAEDAVHASGDVGVMALGVSNVANTAFAADGDYVPIGTDTEGTVRTGGNRAHDAADSGNPVKVGSRAAATLSDDTMIANGDRSDNVGDLDGALITRDQIPLGDLLSERVSNTDGASTAFSNFGAVASTRSYVTAIHVFRTDAGTTVAYVDFRDGTAGSVLFTVALPPNGGAILPAGAVPYFRTSVNTALAFDVSSALTTVYISISGFKSKV